MTRRDAWVPDMGRDRPRASRARARRSAPTAAERHFLSDKRFAVIGTINPSGSPNQTVVWYLLDGDEILINTVRGRQKFVNLARDPRASVMVYDDRDPHRFVRADGRARLITDTATVQADIRRIEARYVSDPAVIEANHARWATQDRVSCRIAIASVYARLE